MTAHITRKIAYQLKKIATFTSGVLIYARRYGLKRLFIKAIQRVFALKDMPSLQRAYDAALYNSWIRTNEPTEETLETQRRHHFKYEPLISLVVPCYQTPINFLRLMVQSVQQQTYQSWQLCLAIAGELPIEIVTYLDGLAKADPRIQIIRIPTNLGIAGNTNAALSCAQGEYVGFIDHDDTLASFALYEVVKTINEQSDSDLIYSDEDKITQSNNQRHTPHFKPNWSPDLLRSYNYITHFLVLKKSLLDQIGVLRAEFDSCQDYDLVLRASEKAKHISHIPLVLYHWREHSGSTSFSPEAKPEVVARSIGVVQDHLKRIERVGQVTSGSLFGSVHIRYDLITSPLVSIIIPNHEHADDLEKCITSILDKSTYKNFEIIIMENHSQDKQTFALYKKLQAKGIRLIKWEEPFNYSGINNLGVKEARGSVILLLNNDVEVISPDWLEQMLMHLQHPEVGAVGAKLYYPDGTIQHAGVVTGIGGIAGHPHKGFAEHSSGYFGRLKVVQNLSAVTGACLMVKKKVFEAVGGLEINLPIAFNDIDLCLKIRQAGYLIVWTPEAKLIHHESKTRGYEDTKEKQKRFLFEIDYFKKKWSDTLRNGDPYYNPNLTFTAENFSINA